MNPVTCDDVLRCKDDDLIAALDRERPNWFHPHLHDQGRQDLMDAAAAVAEGRSRYEMLPIAVRVAKNRALRVMRDAVHTLGSVT